MAVGDGLRCFAYCNSHHCLAHRLMGGIAVGERAVAFFSTGVSKSCKLSGWGRARKRSGLMEGGV